MYQGTLALEEGIQTSENKTFSKGEKGKSFYFGWLRSCKMHLLSRQDALSLCLSESHHELSTGFHLPKERSWIDIGKMSHWNFWVA